MFHYSSSSALLFLHSQSHQQCIFLPEKKDKISLKATSEKWWFPQCSLRKILKFHLISCCGNFVETHPFCRVLGESLKNLRKLCISTKFWIRKLGEIMVFYAVAVDVILLHWLFISNKFYIWDALRGLVPLIQFKKREKYP